ncbi:MAG: zf-HC2 domain-containing protein [Candidatus Omnitrophica bacterium]|nr:zf-HC2 domain-containing protein [Candidatus Omnitrophota bacterium]
MKCSKAKELLSEYIDGALDPGTRTLFEEHIAACRDCREELAFFKTCMKEIGSMEKVKPPADFLDKVHDRLDRTSEFERIMQKVFTPVRTKVSFETAGILAALLLLVVVTTTVLNIYSSRKAGDYKIAKAYVKTMDRISEPVSKPIELVLLIQREVPETAYDASETFPHEEQEEAGNRMVLEKMSVPEAPLDLKGTLLKVEDLVKLAEGKVISIERRKDTAVPQFIIAEIPSPNYSLFMKKLGTLGTVSQPQSGQPKEEMKTKGPIRVQIKLVTAE